VVAGQWWPKAIAQRREAPLTRRHQPLRQWGDRSEAGGRKPGTDLNQDRYSLIL